MYRKEAYLMPKKKTTVSADDTTEQLSKETNTETISENEETTANSDTVVIDVDITKNDENISTTVNDEQVDDNSSYSDNVANQEFESADEIDVSKYEDIEMNSEDDDDIDDEGQSGNNEEVDDSRRTAINRRIASIVTDDRLPEKFSTNDSFKWAELFKYKARSTICEARVIKCMQAPGGNIAVCCQIIGFEQFNMIVPFDLFDAPQSIMNSNVNTKIKYVNKMVGSIINVVIEQLKEGTGVANRTKANYFLRRKFFYRGFKTSPNSAKQIVGKGTIVNNAKILVVHENAIQLEIFGARVRVPVSELSYSMITDCRKEYSVGTTIRCLIMEINPLNDEARNVRLKVSVKQLYEDDTLIPLESAQIGEMCFATVTRITYSSGTIMLYTAAGYNAIATHLTTNVTNLRPGSTVKFQLKSKEKKYGIGEIIHIIEL